MFDIPYNALSWLLGSLAVFTFGFKSLAAYRETGNKVAKIYFGMSMAFGAGFFFYGIVACFTLDTSAIRISYLLGDLGVQIGIQFQVWLLWFIGLRHKIRLRILLLLTSSISGVIMIVESFTSQVAIRLEPLLFISSDEPIALILKCVLYIFVTWPLGYFFLSQAKIQATTKAQLTSTATGLIFIVVSAAAVFNSITNGGSDTYESSIINAVIFVMFLTANLLPRQVIVIDHQVATKGI